MSDFIQFGFISGELAPEIQGRGDLEKYDLGLSLAYNFVVDYRGGLVTRPGTEFIDYIKDSDQHVGFYEFVFSEDEANTYVLLFGNNYIRFIQNGGYVLESGISISAVSLANPGVVTTSAAHGLATGDWGYLTGFSSSMSQLANTLVSINVLSPTTFQLLDVFGDPIDTTGFTPYTSGGIFSRVYTVATPFGANVLPDVKVSQVRDVLRITSEHFFPYTLTRTAHTNWTLAEAQIGNGLSAPTITSADAQTSPNSPPGWGCIFQVTAVDKNGNESIPSKIAEVHNGKQDTSFKIKYTKVTGALYYNIYRSIVVNDESDVIPVSLDLGFVGRSYGTTFISQANTTPDFTKVPPMANNPFANAGIKRIQVLTAGTGYTKGSNVTVTDTGGGTGFIGYAIPEMYGTSSGPMAAIVVVDPGHDYENSTVSVSVGTSATFEVELYPAMGNYPRVSAYFEQRQLYASSVNGPMTIWGSKPGMYNNFDAGNIVVADDSYEYQVDDAKVTPIRHMVPTRGGLMIFAGAGIWQMYSPDGPAVTAKSVKIDLQSETGCAETTPLQIDTDILYLEDKGYTVRLLSYKDSYKVYRGDDVSILSSHFFGRGKFVKHWAYANTPNKVVWAVREDGQALSFTTLKEQNVYAWTQHATRGYFEDVVSVKEDGLSAVYFIVKRKLHGRWIKVMERLANNEYDDIEEAWNVDCGLALPQFYPQWDIEFAAASGEGVAVTATSGGFNSGDVGKIIRFGGGKATVASYVNANTITVDITRPITKLVPETETPAMALADEWTMDSAVTSVSGLKHLEGLEVAALCDGFVVKDLTVANGAVTIPASTKVVVGLPYTCKVKTLPITAPNVTLQNRKKRSVGVAIDTIRSRGLKVGKSFDAADLYEYQERTTEALGEATRAQEGWHYESISPEWSETGQICIVQDNPLPAHLRAIINDVEVGDD